jgi:hypothetical protein
MMTMFRVNINITENITEIILMINEDTVLKRNNTDKFSLCLTKHHSMKAYWGSGAVAPRIL